MKYISLDYGTKYIGIALSDEGGVLAFPNIVIKNDSNAIESILEIIKEESIEFLVCGESFDNKGEKNEIYDDAKAFAEEVAKSAGIDWAFEKEGFTSTHARHAIEGHKESGRIDASAAALILQRYLDRKNKSSTI